MSGVKYIDLLIGEVLLGDPFNTYLYVCEDEKAEDVMMRQFVQRIAEEGQQATAVRRSSGLVVVNGTQRFYFANRSVVQCVAKGTSYDRIFMDLAEGDDIQCMKEYLFPNLVHPGGDFV